MDRDNNYVILRTYKSVWSFERKIHSIEGFKLWVPVSISNAGYFILGVLVTLILSKLLPFVNRVPFIVRYLIIPFGVMKYLTKQKVDGKYPHKFFYDLIVYLLSSKRYYRFRHIDTDKKKIKSFTPVIMRKTLVVDKTDKALKKRV